MSGAVLPAVVQRVFHRLIWERRELRMIAASEYMDAHWYAEQNKDIGEMPAPLHYIRHGAREGRDPGPKFSTLWYLDENPDVKTSGMNPLFHYLAYGRQEGRQPPPPIGKDSAYYRARQMLDEDVRLLAKTDLFDPDWYRETYPDIAEDDPYLHFLSVGGAQGRDASPRFNTASYLALYPDVDAQRINPLIHYLRHGKREGKVPGLSREKLATAQRVVSDLDGLDPEFDAFDPIHLRLGQLPVLVSISTGRVPQAWREVFRSLHDEMKFLYFIPGLRHGDASMAAVNMVRVAREKYSARQILVVLTDNEAVEALDLLPSGTQVLVLSDFDPHLDEFDRQRIVEMLIFSLLPASCMNIDSRAGWNAIRARGKALQAMTQLYAYLPDRDYSRDGRRIGYADTHFRSCLPYLTKLYASSQFFIDDVCDRYGASSALLPKLQALHQPAPLPIRDPASSLLRAGSGSERRRVLWTGRSADSADLALLARIAASLPEIQFEAYCLGEPACQTDVSVAALARSNLTLHTVSEAITEPPDRAFSAILFTSPGEGVPTLLLDAAASGLPIVAGATRGVNELLDHDCGWPVADVADEAAYARAISEAVEKSPATLEKADRMIQKLEREWSWAAFREATNLAPSFLNGGVDE